MFRREENSSHHESSPFNSGHPRGLKLDSLSRSDLFPPFNRHALLTSATLLSVYSFFYTGPSLLFFRLPHTESLPSPSPPTCISAFLGGGGLGSFDGTVTASGEFWASDYFFTNTGETSKLQSLERGVLLLDGSVDYRVCIGHSPGCLFRPVLFSRPPFSSLSCEYIWLIESDKSLTRDFLPASIGPTIRKPWVQIRPLTFLNLTAGTGPISFSLSLLSLFTKYQAWTSFWQCKFENYKQAVTWSAQNGFWL